MDKQMLEYIYYVVYGGVTVLSLVASCYLLFRRANAFNPDITPPARLRRWAATFFAALALCHLWYMPMYFLSSSDDPVLYAYFLLMWVGLIIYMIRAIRQYRCWLRDNYADLEHKEVWQASVMLTIILLAYAFYSLDAGELLYEYAIEVIITVLICYLLWRIETYLLWRIETLSDLSHPVNDTEEVEDNRSAVVASSAKNIGSLLKQYCEEPQLYLQHDISAMQLAKLIGTNRLYLSKHFASQGITYSTYINGLRIQHFINLYHEAVATHQPITVRQLAHKSGFHSYSTFNSAFKQSMGMTASEWMSSES